MSHEDAHERLKPRGWRGGNHDNKWIMEKSKMTDMKSGRSLIDENDSLGKRMSFVGDVSFVSANGSL